MSKFDNPDTERCAHADEHFAYTACDALGLCGCGYHDQIIAEVVNVLRSKGPGLHEGWRPGPRWGELGAELLLHVMDNADLLDHGTSIGGSWVTDKGERLLAILGPLDNPGDYLDQAAGFSCSDCPEKKP